MLLKQAIEAGLPLIAAHTRDLVNVIAVVQHIVGPKVKIVEYTGGTTFEQDAVHVYIAENKPMLDYVQLYHAFTKNSATMLVINSPKPSLAFFDAGEVPVPKDMTHSFLENIVDKKGAETVAGALGGCTLKETVETALITMSREHSLTRNGVVETRRESFQPATGLTPVDSHQAFYQPPQMLKDWVESEAAFFRSATDPRLIPRGLLFDGIPGTGKTAGAKWLAETLGVPLFRVDIGGTKNKYIGASEANLLSNLARLDREEPCVVLFDEIEKMMASDHTDNSGTTATMLSQLLWWLAERRSRVLVVMTTNDTKKLAPELYRDGRIDKTMVFEGVPAAEQYGFLESLAKTFKHLTPVQVKQVADSAKTGFSPAKIGAPKTLTQAELTSRLIRAVKLISKPA